jgi:malonate transporter and related proteins
MAILAEVMVLLSVGSVLMSANSGSKRGMGSLILHGTMFNPIVVAIVLGAALAGTGLALPEAIMRFLGFLRGAAGPVALFALGGALALQRLDRRTADPRQVSAAILLSTLVGVVSFPCMAWLALDQSASLSVLTSMAALIGQLLFVT